MKLVLEVWDNAAYVPGWVLSVIFGVLVGWVRWRLPQLRARALRRAVPSR